MLGCTGAQTQDLMHVKQTCWALHYWTTQGSGNILHLNWSGALFTCLFTYSFICHFLWVQEFSSFTQPRRKKSFCFFHLTKSSLLASFSDKTKSNPPEIACIIVSTLGSLLQTIYQPARMMIDPSTVHDFEQAEVENFFAMLKKMDWGQHTFISTPLYYFWDHSFLSSWFLLVPRHSNTSCLELSQGLWASHTYWLNRKERTVWKIADMWTSLRVLGLHLRSGECVNLLMSTCFEWSPNV